MSSTSKRKKSKTVILVFSVFILLTGLTSCLKDRTFPVPVSAPTGTLVINEFMAYENGSYNDEFGGSAVGEDWIELYNGADTAITFDNRWFLGDSVGVPNKWQFPSQLQGNDITVLPNHYLVIYCDNLVTPYILSDSSGTQLHASFRLSHTSGAVILAHSPTGGAVQVVDTYSYGLQPTKDISMGRLPNGGSNWAFCNTPTPGAVNQ